MDEQAGASGGTKAKAVSDAINNLLQNLVLRCAKAEGVRDYFYVGVIGYGVGVGPAWSGALHGSELVPISMIGNQPAQVEDREKKIPDGAGGIITETVKFPTWFDPVANGQTPMTKAFKLAESILTNWLSEHPNCFPPILINISDGAATDGDPTHNAESVMNLQSSDGNVLVFNLHISGSNATPIEFPDNEGMLPDQYAKLLYNISSVLPEHLKNEAQSEGFSVTDQSRGFIFNSDIVQVIRFIDIGTRASNMR